MLQVIDSHYKNNNGGLNQPEPLYPASLTITIDQLSLLLPIIIPNIHKHFDYAGLLEELINRFFKLLTKKLNKVLRKFNKRSNNKSNSKKRKYDNDNTNNQPPHKRQKVNDAAFGPYKRRHSLRYLIFYPGTQKQKI